MAVYPDYMDSRSLSRPYEGGATERSSAPPPRLSGKRGGGTPRHGGTGCDALRTGSSPTRLRESQSCPLHYRPINSTCPVA